MEFFNFYASGSDDSDSGNEAEDQSNADDQDFIGNIKIDQNPSDYYGLTKVTRSFFDTENNAFSDDDIGRYKNQEKEVKNYALFDDDS